MYRTLELSGENPLKDAHYALDRAVLDAYGFSAKKDLLALSAYVSAQARQALALNLEVAGRIERGRDVVSPGVPPPR